MDQSPYTPSDLELLFAKFATELRSDIQKVEKQIEELSANLHSDIRSDIQKDMEESSTKLRSDIQKVEKQIEESSTKFRSDIQKVEKQIEESSTKFRSDIQKVEKQIEESKTYLLQKVGEKINDRVAKADQNIMWMLYDADTSLGKRVKDIDDRLCSMQGDINRLLGSTSSQDEMSHHRASADVWWSTIEVRPYPSAKSLPEANQRP